MHDGYGNNPIELVDKYLSADFILFNGNILQLQPGQLSMQNSRFTVIITWGEK